MKNVTETILNMRWWLCLISILTLLTNCQESEMNNENYEFIETLHFQKAERSEILSISEEIIKDITGSESIHLSTLTSNQKGQIFLFEWYSGKILKFGNESQYMASAGGRGEKADEFDLENSGVGLILCGDFIIAHDMNRPNVKVYDQNLTFQKKILLDEPIWNISCTDDHELLVIYVSGNPVDIINIRGEVLKSVELEDLITVEFNNLKMVTYHDGKMFTVFAAENLLLIYDSNGEIVRVIRFPTIEDDLNKRITAKVSKIYTHNQIIHVVAKLNFGLVIHRFTQEGDYINTSVLGNEYINIHQNHDDHLYAIKTGNKQLLAYLLN